MHFWGDEWFKCHGNELNAAISELNNGLNKLHVLCCGKEKYGTYRTDLFQLWNGSIRYWNGKWNIYISPSMGKVEQLGCKLAIVLDDIARHINRWLGITKLVQKWQKDKINKLFQEVCMKYPYIADELVCDTDCYMYIKPSKYGNLDGEAIHGKYWRTCTK